MPTVIWRSETIFVFFHGEHVDARPGGLNVCGLTDWIQSSNALVKQNSKKIRRQIKQDRMMGN
jgi:hypothetical protein